MHLENFHLNSKLYSYNRVNTLTKILKKLVSAYVILISLWFLSWLAVGDAFWLLALINRAVPFLFVPVPLLVLLGITFRHSKSLPLLILPALLFVGLYFPYIVPRLLTNAPAPDFTVMTYNVLFANKHYDAVANVILTYKPDLVALQEVQPPMMDALTRRLQLDYPNALMGTQNPFGTTAIFSRTPFARETILDLQSDRPAVVVQTTIKNQSITFAAAHLLAYGLLVPPLEIPAVTIQRTNDQNQQARVLLQELESHDGIQLLGCDCNSPETSSTYRILNTKLSAAVRQVGWQLNPPILPNTRAQTDLTHIDHIFYQGALHPIALYEIQDNGGSDHFPVLSTFVFDK